MDGKNRLLSLSYILLFTMLIFPPHISFFFVISICFRSYFSTFNLVIFKSIFAVLMTLVIYFFQLVNISFSKIYFTFIFFILQLHLMHFVHFFLYNSSTFIPHFISFLSSVIPSSFVFFSVRTKFQFNANFRTY